MHIPVVKITLRLSIADLWKKPTKTAFKHTQTCNTTTFRNYVGQCINVKLENEHTEDELI